MKRLKNIVIVFFLISHGYYLGNPFENCFPCSYFFGGGNTSKNDSESSDSESVELNNFNNGVSENSSFSINGLDIYWLDDFTSESLQKYNQIVSNNEGNDNIGEIQEDTYKIIKTKEEAWIWHFYKKNEDNEINENLIKSIAEQMSTTEGNNFNWEELRDETRKNYKERHNKNVIIIKLKDEKDPLFKNTIFTFRNFVNMSYCPTPIIFTGDFDYKDFEEDLKTFNDEYTKDNKKDDIKIKPGDVDFGEPIDEKTCFYIKQDENFVNNVIEKLELAAKFHNTKEEEIDYDTFNIAIIGAKRAGKSTLTTRILNKLCGKTGNDLCSVSNKIGKFTHCKGKKIPIAVIDVPGFERGKDYDKKLKDWIEKNEKNNTTKVHAIVYLINAKNLPKPDNFGEPLKDITTGKKITDGEFFLKQEVEVFKFLKEKKIPVVFCIARSESVENGYKYLRKFFGDLMLIPEISEYNSNERNWNAEDQWVCKKWTRGTLLQLKDDNEKGLFGLVRLLTCIKELYENNDEYKQRLPNSFFINNTFNTMFENLKTKILEQKYKKIWKKKNEDKKIKDKDSISFFDDDITGPLRSKNNNKDMISEIFEKPLIDSLKQLHENSWYVGNSLDYAKEILNYVCAYDYSKDNNTITEGVINKMIERRNGVEKFGVWALQKLIKLIIKMSLPDKEFLKNL